jgi:Flp pilus assembly protein TadB
MKAREKSTASEVVPWWLFVVVVAVAAVAVYASVSGRLWLWAVALAIALVTPRMWWRALRKRWRDPTRQ